MPFSKRGLTNASSKVIITSLSLLKAKVLPAQSGHTAGPHPAHSPPGSLNPFPQTCSSVSQSPACDN